LSAVVLAGTVACAKAPQKLTLSPETLKTSFATNFDTNPNGNVYEVEFSSPEILKEKKFFLVFESDNPEFSVGVMDSSEELNTRSKSVIDLLTFSGNLMFVMSDTFFNDKLAFVRTSNVLRFMVYLKTKMGNKNYKVRAEIADRVDLTFGQIYTTRVDMTLSSLEVSLVYNGAGLDALKKLRFQLTVVKHKDPYTLACSVSHEQNSYQMNNIFRKVVGGILSKPEMTLCSAAECRYDLAITLSNVKSLNIESFMVKDIERISVNHYEEFYDRVYSNDAQTTYELVYDPSMEEMDLSVSLVPVTGTCGLYINAKTLQNDIERFDWKEKGNLAKRITIKWSELVAMKAEKSSLFIVVKSPKSGEFLLKVDAHESGYRGRLTSGVVEQGFLEESELTNYLYFFEVVETQDIVFQVNLNTVSGNVYLYLKQCESFNTCKITKEEVRGENTLEKIENNQQSKTLRKSFRCEHSAGSASNICEFVVGVFGKENHGSHYEISLTPTQFHRLMLPGHVAALNLAPEEEAFLKFSLTPRGSANVHLSVEPLWGSFDVFVSKTESFPNTESKGKLLSFSSTKSSLYDSWRTVDVAQLMEEDTANGIYYVGVKASSTAALNLKYFERDPRQPSVHTLLSGVQTRGAVADDKEVVYYTFKVSLDSRYVSSISVDLTPLKGSFLLFGSRKGKLPTLESREFFSQNHHLELPHSSTSAADGEEFTVGVKLAPGIATNDANSFQFYISLTYANRPLKLSPGVMVTQSIDTVGLFFIEIYPSMGNLLIVKSIKDGYNLNLCGAFSSDQEHPTFDKCAITSNEKNVSVFLEERELKEGCEKAAGTGKPCFLFLKLEGFEHQGFSVGFTYNDHPFHLAKNLAFQGPSIVAGEERINFIYHPEPGQPVSIYFNSKGQKMAIYTKLGSSAELNDADLLTFPTASTTDQVKTQRTGYVTNIYYSAEEVNKIAQGQAELLISVRGTGPTSTTRKFDPVYPFVLQTSMDSRELIRTDVIKEYFFEDEYRYFTFYNNGNSQSLRVYANANVATRLEMIVAQGVLARPPFTSKGLVTQVGIGSVQVELSPQDFKLDSHRDAAPMRDHFTVALKSSAPCTVDIFWNNRQELNYIELTPNHPMTMSLEKDRSFYFSLFARDVDAKKSRGNVVFFIKTNVRANIFVVPSETGALEAPSRGSYVWKSSIPDMGGVAMVEVRADDPKYCMDCTYIGSVETLNDGTVSVLGAIRHDNTPSLLAPGFTFPDYLNPHSKTVYRIYNPDADIVDLSVSLLSGTVNIFISDSDDISETKYKEMHSVEAEMQVHKFIVIRPANYNITTYHDFFVLVSNPKLDPAAFTIAIDKNSFKSPIEPGITKFLSLAAAESTDFFYRPKAAENLFEVRLELRQVFDKTLIPEGLAALASFVEVYHLNENNEKYLLKYKSKSASQNKIYISFNITENTQGVFTVHLYNPLSCGVSLSLDLLNGGYKLVNMNEFMVDVVRDEDTTIYEAYTTPGKLLFVDVKMCVGDVGVSFYQDDYENVADKNYLQYNTLKDTNSFVHYLKVNSTKVFLKVAGAKPPLAIYEITVMNEKDLDVNPYSEITQGEAGKVSIETDNHVLRFAPIKIKSTYSNQFTHRVTYTAFLSDDFQVMRFGRNCGHFMLSEAFENPHLVSFEKVVEFTSVEQIEREIAQLKLAVPGLRAGTKYYGVIVAKIELFPLESGYVSPARSAKTFYDEFVFVTSKYRLPFNLLISVAVCVGLLLGLFCIVKAYVFGNINKMRGLEKLTDLSEFDENVLGFNIVSILEKEYYGEEPRAEEAASGEPTQPHSDEEAPKTDIEMTDKSERSTPLDS